MKEFLQHDFLLDVEIVDKFSVTITSDVGIVTVLEGWWDQGASRSLLFVKIEGTFPVRKYEFLFLIISNTCTNIMILSRYELLCD